MRLSGLHGLQAAWDMRAGRHAFQKHRMLLAGQSGLDLAACRG